MEALRASTHLRTISININPNLQKQKKRQGKVKSVFGQNAANSFKR